MIPNNVLQVLLKVNPALRNMQTLKDVKSPDEMAQFLLNSGKVTQEQVNHARQMWERPDVRKMVQSKYPI